MPTENPEDLKKLLDLVRTAAKQDDALREKYVVGEKFRFVHDRLYALLEHLEKKAQVVETAIEKEKNRVGEDEVLVYVYLYNAQGLILRSWVNMLTPKVFYEYSVNRPIYIDKAHVESMLRSKTNKAQHAFLTVAVKRADIIESAETTQRKDQTGNPLLRVREGSLHFDNLIFFTHNEHEYIVNSQGELVKKA